MQGQTTRLPSPKELEAQSSIHVDEWVEVGSPRFHKLLAEEDQYSFYYILQVGLREPPFLLTDSLGRLWGKGNGDKWFPFHDIIRGKVIGYVLPSKVVH